MNYKDTLNLPKTSFPMKASLAKREPEMIDFWNKVDIYKLLRKKRKNRPKYILHDGPPYANGPIHIGHALNKILKDIVVKYKFLSNFDSPFVAGWDCHGLPIEHQLFKEIKQTKHDVDTVKFRKRAYSYSSGFVKLQTEDFKRLGLLGDWQKPYLTFNPDYEYSVMKLLQALVSQGYIYRGRKPVNWCSHCETALAEAEVEYANKTSDSIYFLFECLDSKKYFDTGQNKKIYFCVWTTTPWTVVSNTAVAVCPQLTYNLVRYRDKLIVIAGSLQEDIERKLGEKFKNIKTIAGEKLEGAKLAHPFQKRISPVVLADFVSSQEGTGCVHIAPGHGQEDFSLLNKYSLELIMPIAENGKFIKPDKFKGKNIDQANKLVLDALSQKGNLIFRNQIEHSYPHCWRCKKPIIFRATYQWFLDIGHKDLRRRLLDEVNSVKWIPASGTERMKLMLKERPDWCLSRQRLWGAPIPAIKCQACQKVILNPEVISRAAETFKSKGADSWFIDPIDHFIPEDFSCPDCKGKKFVKEFDILDVWFESGASFSAVLKNNKQLNFPADLYLEGSDQHRGWFQVSLIPSVALEEKPPYKTVLTHGFVVDGEGKKMSKSLGNVIAPQDISKKYGAEILRFWAACSDYREDVKISESIIKQVIDSYRKIRNTIRFILGNIYDFNSDKNPAGISDLPELDRYMLSRTMLFFDEVVKAYDSFNFYKVCQSLFDFCNQELSSFYLDILKDRLYTFSPDSHARRSSQFVLSKILFILLKLMSPVLSFTAEEAYRCWDLKDKDPSIFISEIKGLCKPEWIDSRLLNKWSKLIDLRQKVLKEIEKQRANNYIGSSLQARVVLFFEPNNLEFYKSNQKLLKEIFIVSDVLVNEGEFSIKIEKAEGKKCIRCWNWTEDTGANEQFPQICQRCVKAIKEAEYDKEEKQ